MLSKVCGYISSSLHPPFAEEQPSLSTQTALACAMAKFFVCPCHHVVYFLQLCIVCCCCAQTKVFEEILFEQRQFRENARVLAQLQHYFLLCSRAVKHQKPLTFLSSNTNYFESSKEQIIATPMKTSWAKRNGWPKKFIDTRCQ